MQSFDRLRQHLFDHKLAASGLLTAVLGMSACSSSGTGGQTSASFSGDAGSIDATVLGSDAGVGGNPDSDGGPAQDGTLTIPSTCADLASRVCGAIQTCAPYFLTIATSFGDAAACVRALTDDCNHFQATGHPLDMASCARALAVPYCNAVLATGLDHGGLPEICHRPRGTGSGGEPCASPNDCQSQNCYIANGLCGTCATESGDGGPCNGTSFVCAPDLVCNGTRCVPPVAPGSPCTAIDGDGGGGGDDPCPGGTSCVNGRCQPVGGLDASCDVVTTFCDNAHGIGCKMRSCQPFSLAAIGQPCGQKLFTDCPAGSFCVQESTCKPTVGLGGGCGLDAGGVFCSPLLWCDPIGVCTYDPVFPACP